MKSQTSRAKYYIYRNLHTNTFSVRYKGLVIAHPYSFIAENVTFKVNEKGRQRVVKERRKNVHAFIVCDSWKDTSLFKVMIANKVEYNPYVYTSFMFSCIPIKDYPHVAGVCGKDLYLLGQKE